MFDISRVHDVIVDDVRIPALLANRTNGSIQCNVFLCLILCRYSLVNKVQRAVIARMYYLCQVMWPR